MNGKKKYPQFISVPFKASSPNGLLEYNGIAKFSSAGIVVEFESKVFGLIGGEVKEVRIALDEILNIKFRKGLVKFFAQIKISLQNFTKVSELPNHSGKVKLKIKREDFELAEAAVEQTTQFINEMNMQISSTENDPVEQLPPMHTPVSRLFDESEDTTKELDDLPK